MLETVYSHAQAVVAPDRTEWSKSAYFSAGVRWAYNLKSGMQIVPGIAIPVGI